MITITISIIIITIIIIIIIRITRVARLLRAKHYTPEIAKGNFHRKMPLDVKYVKATYAGRTEKGGVVNLQSVFSRIVHLLL